ncbi:MAG: alpha/beta fold hydrolase [Rhodospirillales bacterium]|nr:alpha/beta fold hydrolase [Alphaproteobacteria bacterium]MCB9986991.1 alpha/beta fold hydrolase [Rhodospirillales bacterium]USO08235.1 MAG: alpha/beta fold hydrolase [Rhodospirillales bacterium]
MMNIRQIGTGPATIVWAHGWGHSGEAFAPLAQSLAGIATSYLIDFPGHGATPPPPEAWGTREFADAAAQFLKTLPAPAALWVGHSFGCRVGIQLAAHYPGLFRKLALIAPAGLRRRRTMFQKISHNARVYTFKTLKHMVPEGPRRDALRARFGSSDYRRAGVLRDSFVRIVNEDLGQEAEQIACPTLIVVGANDRDTPPEMAHRLHAKIHGSQLHVLDGFDHNGILGAGRHQVAALIQTFLDEA